MNIKRRLIGVATIIMGLSILVGCSSLGFGKTITEEEKYTALSHLVTYPNPSFEAEYKTLSGKFTFSVFTVSDKEVWNIEDKEKTMVSAVISRNAENIILLDIDALSDYDYPAGTLLSITGKLAGSVYWVSEGDQIEVLNVVATKAELLPNEESAPLENSTFSVDTLNTESKYTFESAVATQSMGRNAAYLYFEFENNSTNELNPTNHNLFYYQGDVELKKTILNADGPVDSDALNTRGDHPTDPGENTKYFETLIPYYEDEELSTTDPIEITQYDDDFNQVQVWIIDLQ